MTARKGLAQSVMTRLVTYAKETDRDATLVFGRFVLERFLYRLSVTRHADRFILKGATLMPVWLGDTARPTRDADLAGFGDLSNETLHAMMVDVCSAGAPEDGVIFDTRSIRAEPIRENDEYGGTRVKLIGRIGDSRMSVQLDIGIGDAVFPSPEVIELPALLDFPGGQLRAYRPETSIAEKFHAIATLGMANSRMKDFYDIDRLATELAFDAAILRVAIEKTFARRKTELPTRVPDGLTDAFPVMQLKQMQWRAFVGRISGGEARPFVEVVRAIREFLLPVLAMTKGSWPPRGPWRER